MGIVTCAALKVNRCFTRLRELFIQGLLRIFRLIIFKIKISCCWIMSSDEHLETLNMTSVRGLLQLHIYPHVNTVYPHITYLPPANKVWGKVIFSVACVKNSVHRGGEVPGHVTPGQVHPQVGNSGQVPPLGRLTSPGQVHPPGRYTPRAGTPPRAVHAGRYGQQAVGTHPTHPTSKARRKDFSQTSFIKLFM